MASDPRAARLTEAHRLAQARLAAVTVAQLDSAWPLLAADDLDGTVERWLRVTVPIVRAQHATSARLAANYYTAFRLLETGVAEPFVPVVAETVPVEAVATSLTVTGPVAVKTHMRTSPIVERAMEIGRAMSASAGMRHVLNGGRQTVTDSVWADRRALGWARVTSGRACAFCAMIASRGPVFGDDTANFDAHDHCSCSAEPVYRSDAAWPPGARQYRQLWDEVTAGLSGADARLAFRNALSAA